MCPTIDKAKSAPERAEALLSWLKEQEGYLLKPMNCPHHIQIYKAEPRSYRDLPVRLAEFGTVYRFEQTGELSGHDPRPRLHPGRRPPVRHPRADRGGDAAPTSTWCCSCCPAWA